MGSADREQNWRDGLTFRPMGGREMGRLVVHMTWSRWTRFARVVDSSCEAGSSFIAMDMLEKLGTSILIL
jgi:hypothetical protein